MHQRKCSIKRLLRRAIERKHSKMEQDSKRPQIRIRKHLQRYNPYPIQQLLQRSNRRLLERAKRSRFTIDKSLAKKELFHNRPRKAYALQNQQSI